MANSAGANNPAFTHGHTTGKFSPEYHSWASMLQRCTNPKRNSYKHYGGKGVIVCAAWYNFEQFLRDIGPRPLGTSLERRDNEGNYAPENCCWADKVTQARNSSQVVWVEIAGIRKRLVDWCSARDISVNTVRDRVKHHNMSYAQAIMTPVQTRPGQKLLRILDTQEKEMMMLVDSVLELVRTKVSPIPYWDADAIESTINAMSNYELLEVISDAVGEILSEYKRVEYGHEGEIL